MPDHATSSSPAVQAQLDRLWSLSPGADILGLERITALLARVGNPHLRLPPVFHVAGTNGKGSTCAFLRAALEAAGHKVHVYTSPHLVRFNERIRLAGRLIADEQLAPLLAEVLDAGGDVGASFFEVTTAAAFLAFARTPADACVIEVGLGGRLDATNVIRNPVACGIAALGIDHQAFLGDTLEAIAAEKAGIAKPGVPLVTMRYPAEIAAVVARVAAQAGAPVTVVGETDLPTPALPGVHQRDNLALAAAMLRAQDEVSITGAAIATAATAARWPARLQRLADGPLTALAPTGSPVWLDGGHNPSAGEAIAAALDRLVGTASGIPHRLAVVLGMLANKDLEGFLAPFADRIDALVAVPVPGHDHHGPAEVKRVAQALGIARFASAATLADAMHALVRGSDPRGMPPAILIAGSLYLAGEALSLNDEPPQ